MGLGFLKWIIPIVMELFKGNDKYQSYFKRNKTISLLVFACLICLGLSLFFFEQATIHGTNSKQHHTELNTVKEKLKICEEKNETLSVSQCK